MKEIGRKGFMGKVPTYEESLKVVIARDYLTGQLSYSQIAKKYNLPTGDTARYFVSCTRPGQKRMRLNLSYFRLRNKAMSKILKSS